MDEELRYRRKLASAYVRLFRPLAPRGPRRTRFDRMTARWWTRIDVRVFRRTGISLGVKALGVDDVLLLRTRGRVSGQVREVLVAFVEVGGVPHVCAANGGSDRPPAWYLNLRGGEPVEIERRGRRETVVPTELVGDEREGVFEIVYHTFPHVRLYLAHTSRTFPIVALAPLAPCAIPPVVAGAARREESVAGPVG
jgi:F420H(2)-dependent quinone reductase